MIFKIMNLLGTPNDFQYTGITKLPLFSLNFPKFEPKKISTQVPQLENDPLALDIVTSMLQFNPAKRP